MKTLVLLTLAVFTSLVLKAQFDIKYIDKCGYFQLSGGNIESNEDMKRTDETGLFAKNGYFFGLDYNHTIAYGFGLGMNLQFDWYNFNKPAFAEFAHTDQYRIRGKYNSTRWGLNIVQNIPIVMSKDNLVINIYGEGNAGIRSFNIPSIDLYYSEIENKWIEVNYRTRINTMGYLGFSAGIQFIFNNVFGINISYSEVLPSRHSVHYSVRLTDAFDKVSEHESYLHSYFNSKSLQFGLFLLIGKN